MAIQTMTKLEVLIAAMREGYVSFTYRKVDGTIRHAIGTRDIEKIIDITGMALSGKKEHSNTTPYFDLAKMEWRCFKNENLMSIEFSDVTEKEALEIACTLQVEVNDIHSFERLKSYIKEKGYRISITDHIVSIQQVGTTDYPEEFPTFDEVITITSSYSINERDGGSDYDIDKTKQVSIDNTKHDLLLELAELKQKESEIYKLLALWEGH